MINLNLTYENIKFLEDLAHELVTQDRRATADPYYYVIREEVRAWGMDELYSSDCAVCYRNGDFCQYDTLEEVREQMYDYYIDDAEMIEEIDSWQNYIDAIDFVKDKEPEHYEVMHYRKEYKYSRFFLTEKEAERHLKLNKHHYNSTAVTYVKHAWRSPNIAKLLDIVKKFHVL